MDERKSSTLESSRRSRTTIQLNNPRPTEINLTIQCDTPEQARAFATWAKHEVQALKAMTEHLSPSQDVQLRFDENIDSVKAA